MDPNLLRGTLPTLILTVLAEGPSYGYEISERLRAHSGGRLKLSVSALYTTIKLLEAQGFIGPCEGLQRGARERRYYEILPTGRAYLKRKLIEWRNFRDMVAVVFTGGAPQA